MHTQLRPIHSNPPQAFRYSLDWRFLLPMGDEKNVYVLCEEQADLPETLAQVCITASNQISFAAFRENNLNNIQVLALPFGLSTRWTGATHREQIEFYVECRRSIVPGGCLLVGFNNAWYFRASTSAKYYSSTPQRVTDQLRQAGFRVSKIFGAMPNLNIPEYIFQLDSQAVYFSMQHRFLRKPILLSALHALKATVGLARISNFLPCYFVIASA